MPYCYFVLKGSGHIKDIPLFYQYFEEPLRPVLHQVVDIKGKQYKVIDINPISNPVGGNVTYYLEPYNTFYPYRTPKKSVSHGGYGMPEFSKI